MWNTNILMLREPVVRDNIQLGRFRYDHLDAAMKALSGAFSSVIAVDRKAKRPLHWQIYDAYRAMVVGCTLRAGQQIPSTRALASELGVSRMPVLTAYAQLLAEGYFEARVGAGTFVSSSLPDQMMSCNSTQPRLAATPSGSRPASRRSSRWPRLDRAPWLQGWGAFNVGQVAFDHFPLHIWSKLVARHCRKMGARSFHYGDRMGSAVFRQIIAGYLGTARTLRCEAGQIMIVSGSQQALEISARVLLDPGSRVWLEEPGYLLAQEVLTMAGCRIVSVPVDEEGLDVGAGIRQCRKARAAFVSPSHQFPLGATMSASRRLQLLDWAQSSGSWIIEDDYDSEYRYESMPIASLQGLDANSRVIYIGTFSKVLFPSLRLGYVVIPSDLVDRFVAVRRAMDICPPSFHQEVAADFIAEGHFARHLRRMRVLYSERRSALIENVNRELGSLAEVLGSEAGMHVTVGLPNGTRDVDIAESAARQNLWIWPLSRCYLGKVSRPGFVLGFGGTALEEIPRAVCKLRSLLAVKRAPQ